MNTPSILSPWMLSLSLASAHAQGLPDFASRIDARAIAVISDGDFRVSTYRDNRLAVQAPDYRDVLTVLRPGVSGGRAEVAVSNSVTAPPEVMAVAPDGRFVYVVERLGQRTAVSQLTRDLAPGRRLSAIDITDPARPRVVASVDAGPMIESVRISPDGRHLALTANSGDAAMVQIVAVDGAHLGVPRSFALDELGISRRAGQPRGGINATFADWHPSGRILSVNLNTRNQILFLQVVGSGSDVRLVPWGEPVTVGRDPFVGRFTPDGSHYLSADWGRDFEAKDLEGRLPRARSTVSVIKLATRDLAGSVSARHEVVSSVQADRSSEGLAISRDGLHVATINMRETALAPDSPRRTREASISYFRFDAARSTLTKVDDYAFEGVLPEGGTFDASGRHFLATVFEYDGDVAGGGVEVWQVGPAERPGLRHLGRIAVPHGAHHVEIVP